MTVDINTVIADLQKALADAQAIAAPVPTPSPSTDFAKRAAGSLRSWDFSQGLGTPITASTVVPFPSVMWYSGTSNNPVLDSSQGLGAVRFDVPGKSDSNAGGEWVIDFSDDLKTQFGAGEEWFMQWRQRFNQAYIDAYITQATPDASGVLVPNSTPSAIKQVIVSAQDTPTQHFNSCVELELVCVSHAMQKFPILYQACGWSTPVQDGQPGSPDDFRLQNQRPSPFCLYSQAKALNTVVPPGCFADVANEWMTFQIGVAIGALDTTKGMYVGSRIRLWGAREGQASNLLIDLPFDIRCGSPAQTYGKAWFGAYMTNKDPAIDHPLLQTWVAEFIVSRQPILDPVVLTIPPQGTAPSPPPSPVPPPSPAPGSVAASFYTGMASGTIKNISINTVHSVDPCPKNTCAYSGWTQQRGLFNDTGAVYMPALGSLGTIVFTGGGHSDYYGNEVYGFDLATQLVSRLTEPWPTLYRDPVAVTQEATLTKEQYWRLYHAHAQLGELWVDGTFPASPTGDGYPAPIGNKATLPDQPGASHMYGYQVSLPQGFGTTDALGALLTTCRSSLTPVGSAVGMQAHLLPMTPGPDGKRHWQRFGSNLMTQTTGFTGAFLDRKRKIVLSHTYNNNFDLLDLVTSTRRLQAIGGAKPGNSPYYGTWMHDEARDLYVWFRGPVGPTAPLLWIVDPTTFSLTVAPLSGSIPLTTITVGAQSGVTHGGSAWVPALGGLVYYAGDGTLTAYSVLPSGDPKAAPWVIAPIAFAGDAPPIQFSPFQSFHMGRFVYVEPLDGFFWLADTVAPIQFWKR